MKRFTFPLEQVRSWNATQLQIEEAALEVIVEQQRRTEAAYAELCAQRAEFEHSTLHKAEIESTELVRLGEFRTFVAVEGNRLRVARLQFEREIAQRRARLIELRRKIELFDRLKQRQRAAWTAEEAKELQAGSDEVFLQKLVARRE